MKFQLANTEGGNTITAYGPGYVDVRGKRHESSLVVTAETVHALAGIAVDTLSAEHFAWLASLAPEIVLLGTGSRLRFPHPSLTRALIDAQIGLEVMDLGAACRTYNLLMGEGRRVVVVLLFD